MPDRALADYNEAIRLNPEHSRAYCGRGVVYFALGRDDLALADLDKATRARSQVCESLQLSRRHPRPPGPKRPGPGRLRRRSSACLPSRAGAYKDRGGLLVRMRQFDRAIEDLDEAIRLDPKRAAAYQNRGAAWNGLGRYEQAIEDLSKAIELDPDKCRRFHEPRAGAFRTRPL